MVETIVHECSTVELEQSRWSVRIKVLDSQGDVIGEYVASADHGYTGGDGIWFGTRDEYREETEQMF